MKKKTIQLCVMAAVIIFTSSCSQRIVGTWTVQRYETLTPGQPGVALSNIGTVEFKPNGTGEKNLSYTVLGITRNDQSPFKWNWSADKYVSINSDGSDFSKTWIIVQNKKKFQKWKSTDGTNAVQVIELKK